MKQRYFIITFVTVIFSIILGILSHDLVIGGSILCTGLLNAYFAGEGKRCNYILGLMNYLLMGYVSFQNQLYGIFFFYIFIFAPLQIQGFINWKKNLDEGEVKIREFNFKNSIIIVSSCLLGSLLLGYLLTLIPGQRLAFLDSSSNCINLCGVVLMILRFKEAWWLWLINNIIDLVIWMITFFAHGEGASMMLLVSIGYLLMNVYGIIRWNLKARSERNEAT